MLAPLPVLAGAIESPVGTSGWIWMTVILVSFVVDVVLEAQVARMVIAGADVARRS